MLACGRLGDPTDHTQLPHPSGILPVLQVSRTAQGRGGGPRRHCPRGRSRPGARASTQSQKEEQPHRQKCSCVTGLGNQTPRTSLHVEKGELSWNARRVAETAAKKPRAPQPGRKDTELRDRVTQGPGRKPRVGQRRAASPSFPGQVVNLPPHRHPASTGAATPKPQEPSWRKGLVPPQLNTQHF